MKPRSRIKKRFCELAESLPPAGAALRKWAKRHCFEPEALYWQHRGHNQEIWCQCCGHREPCDGWLVMSTSPWKCPECGARCEVANYHDRRGDTVDRSLLSVVDVHEGIQVVRTFEAGRCNNYGSATHYLLEELFQVWITDRGREYITSRGYARTLYWIGWNYGAPYQIGCRSRGGGGYYIYNDMYDISGNWFYPKMKIAPYLEMRGVSRGLLERACKKYDIATMMREIVIDPRFETLAKTGYEQVLFYFLGNRLLLDRYWKALNICHRNGYAIPQPGMWRDYVDNLAELGLDTRSPVYLCPPDLPAAHDRMLARIQRKRNREAVEKRRAEIAAGEKRFRETRGKFFGLVFPGEHVSVRCIRSVDEVYREGAALHHCVFTNKYYERDESLLLSARDNTTHKPVETIEVSLDSFKVLQSRGACNQDSPFHEEILRLVCDNMQQIRRAAAGPRKYEQ